MADLISLKNIKRHYDVGGEVVRALDGVDLVIKENEYISIMGPSGSGKSTLMNMIGCLDTPTDGIYKLNNNPVNKLSDNDLAKIRNKEIGFVFQSFHLLARSSALDNVMLPLKYAGEKKSKAIERAKKALLDVGLDDRMDHSPSELSGGQQQRVAIARALVNSPSILFADEPTGNLDAEASLNVFKLIKSMANNLGISTIIATHDLELANRMDKILY